MIIIFGASGFLGTYLVDHLSTRGLAVVATDIDGYASVLAHNEDGLLVPPRDEESLADALLSLLNDKSLRQQMGAKGRIKSEKYSWANVAQQIMDYYNDLLG